MAIVGMTDTRPAPLSGKPFLDRLWNLIGWLCLVGAFAYRERMQPYYFTQDDALVGELPGILLGCRSYWQGVLPNWNPYVFMGAPLASIGFWALTYPPQLLAYAIARHVLGDEFATMEVFAALHLAVGFAAMRYLGRKLGMGALIANIAALSFVLAGCILIMGRSWHAFIANAVWLPLLGIAIQRFREGPVGWKWVLGVGTVLGLAYHAGFPQIAVILDMFFVTGIAVIGYADRLSWRRVAPVVPALLFGIGLSAPLLIQHLQMTGSHERFVPAETGIYDALQGSVLPYPLVEAALPTGWGTFHFERMGHFYFFGGVFALLFAVQALSFWIYLPERGAWARAWWVPCGVVALLMVLGEPAYLWKGLAALPMSKFFLRYTFRFYPWLAFCAILAGGLILERALATLRRKRAWEVFAGAGLILILGYHITQCQPSFYSYGFRPYPDLPTEFESVFHPYDDKDFIGAENSRRIASWTNLRSIAPDHYLALPLNLPHYYQVPSIFGYDPVVEGQPRMLEVFQRMHDDPVAACKAYGVGWHLFGYTSTPVYSPNPVFAFMEQTVNFEAVYRQLSKESLIPRAEVRGTTLMEMPGVDPLAFVSGHPQAPLPMRLSCAGADIDVAGLAAGTPITINFLHYPQMKCTLGGKPLTVSRDDWQRITITLPESGQTLNVRFEPPWLWTCAAGAELCLVAIWLAFMFAWPPFRL